MQRFTSLIATSLASGIPTPPRTPSHSAAPRGTFDDPEYYARGPDIPVALRALQGATRSADRLDLAPLDREQTARQLAGILGATPDEATVGRIHASAEGTMTVRMICRSPAPRKRAEWMRSASTERASTEMPSGS